MVARFQKQVPQETGSGSCQLLKARGLETDKSSLSTYSIRQSTEYIFKGGDTDLTSPLESYQRIWGCILELS